MPKRKEDWNKVGGIPVPTHMPEKWQNVAVVPGYTVSFQLLSRNIVLTTPAGIATVAAINGVSELRDKFLAEVLGANASFIEIKDFHLIPGLPNRESRRRQVELYMRDSDRCIGFVACGLNSMMSTMIRVGLLINQSPFPYVIKTDLEDAVQAALVLEQEGLTNHDDVMEAEKIQLDSWCYEDNWLQAETWVIAPHICGIKVSGWVRDEHVEVIADLQRQVFESGSLDLSTYYRVWDLSGLEGSDWSVRKQVGRDIRAFFEEFGEPRYSYICGANRKTQATIKLFLALFMRRIAYVPKEEDALQRIRSSLRNVNPPPSEDTETPVMDADIRQLVQDIAHVSWKKSDLTLPNLPINHRLFPVYEALSLIHLDIQSAFEAAQIDNERIEQAQATLDTALQARTEMLRVANHELRTPLNGLLGMLELLESCPTTPETRSYMETARRCSYDIERLLANLLDLSSLEIGRFQLANAYFSPRRIIQDLDMKYAHSLRSRGVQFRIEEQGETSASVFGDQKRVHQILDILLQNASKLTASGHVHLGAKAMAFDDQLDMEFVVADTGLGFQAQDLDRVFNPYGKGDYDFARQFGSIGLGLTIVNQVTQILGGHIEVASAPMKGASFTFRLKLPRQL